MRISYLHYLCERDTACHHVAQFTAAAAELDADAATVVSTALRDHFVARHGVDPEKFTVVPNGADVVRFHPDVTSDPALRYANSPVVTSGLETPSQSRSLPRPTLRPTAHWTPLSHLSDEIEGVGVGSENEGFRHRAFAAVMPSPANAAMILLISCGAWMGAAMMVNDPVLRRGDFDARFFLPVAAALAVPAAVALSGLLPVARSGTAGGRSAS